MKNLHINEISIIVLMILNLMVFIMINIHINVHRDQFINEYAMERF